jgi:hypothetical protein
LEVLVRLEECLHELRVDDSEDQEGNEDDRLGLEAVQADCSDGGHLADKAFFRTI